jgi:HD-like signal output (HDOD) protein
MKPAIFELAIAESGIVEPGHGVLAAYLPASEGFSSLVVAGCDPRHDPGQPIESLASLAFSHINDALAKPSGVRWVIVDNWGRFFEAAFQPASEGMTPLLQFKRFPGGVGVDAFTKELGAVGEAALEMLSAVIEGSAPESMPTSARQFLEAVELHGNLPSPGALFHAVSTAAVTGDINAAAKAIQLDPVISASLINYANAAAYAAAGRTGSVSEAIHRLGLNQVRRVVFVAEMMIRYQRGACPEFDYKAYWHNAVATGAAMRGLMDKFGISPRLADDAFTAGLLSGVGWLAIAETFPQLMSDYCQKALGQDPTTKTRLQQEFFPTAVSEVTATYLGRFDFPDTVKASIKRSQSEESWVWFDCLASAVRVAQSLSPFENLAIPTNIPVPDPCREEWQRWQALLVRQ